VELHGLNINLTNLPLVFGNLSRMCHEVKINLGLIGAFEDLAQAAVGGGRQELASFSGTGLGHGSRGGDTAGNHKT
jgi:hypothetical protein